MYLLDTNACNRILNNSSSALVTRLRQHRPDEIALCSVVKAELLYGAQRSSRIAENLRVLDRFFEPFYSFPFDDNCMQAFSRIRTDLERTGTPIGPYDLLIAATAVAGGRTLVTANTREFSHVAGLTIENWEEVAAG
ncbi:MAG: type II toxin-antitoxin system VapC family toxin [Anaerolineae bacterium]|nr:MAG: type II toxin-antitoxin system VapC family toxin [Anaerolineae bacterium]